MRTWRGLVFFALLLLPVSACGGRWHAPVVPYSGGARPANARGGGRPGGGDDRVPRVLRDPPQLPPAPVPNGGYDWYDLPIFAKCLFHFNDDYLRPGPIDYRRGFLSALEGMQFEMRELRIEFPSPDAPDRVMVHVWGKKRAFSTVRLDNHFQLRARLDDVFRFIQAGLKPRPFEATGAWMERLEVAAVNGFFRTFDSRSVLIESSENGANSGADGLDGSVGLVVQETGGVLQVSEVVPDSPAAQAGVRAKDRLVAIDDDPTVNMTVQQAVVRLLGRVGTPLGLTVERAGAKGAQKLSLSRALVSRSPALSTRVIESVGYLHVGALPGGIAKQVAAAVAEFGRQNVKGIILDLRDNGGGIYDEAIKLADVFVKSGTLATLVSREWRREVQATDQGAEPDVPLVVLVNRNTASGAELVAAAIGQRDRGIVVGQPTFGLGRTQQLYEIPAPQVGAFRRKLGLRLTTAEWLTPAGRSVRRGGVALDLLLEPVRVNASTEPKAADQAVEIDEASQSQVVPPTPPVSLLFLEDGAASDFPVEIARAILVGASPKAGRQELLQDSNAALGRLRAAEEAKIVAAWKAKGIDWRMPAAVPEGGRVELTLKSAGERGGPIVAGGSLRLHATAKNVGKVPLYRVRAALEGATARFKGRELTFGRIAPGETRTAELTIKLPSSAPAQVDVVSARVTAAATLTADARPVTIEITKEPSTAVELTFQALAGGGGGGRAERTRLPMTVKNVGGNPTGPVEALLDVSDDDGLSIVGGYFDGPSLAPGATRTFPQLYELDLAHAQSAYVLTADLVLGSARGEKEFPIGQTFTQRMRVGGVGYEESAKTVRFPTIDVTAPPITDAAAIELTGVAATPDGVRDVSVDVFPPGETWKGLRVFYAANPRAESKLSFTVRVPLAPGSNPIRVVAETDKGSVTKTWLLVLRGPAGTP